MPNTVSNVTTGKPQVAGGIFRAPSGTAVPTSCKTALAADYKSMGYIGEDGVTNANSPESDTGKAWGGEIVIAYQTEKPDTYQFVLIESKNTDALKAVYGDDNVSGTLEDEITINATVDDAVEAVWIIEMALRDDYLKRIVIPKGKIVEVGDIVYKDDEITGYEVTVQAFPFEGKTTHKEYIAKKVSTTSNTTH